MTLKGAVDHQVLPAVEPNAMRTIHGRFKVGVRIIADSTGSVTNVRIESHGPSRYFATRALEAARQWTFRPAQVNGVPVSSEWVVRFEFSRGGTTVAPVEVKP